MNSKYTLSISEARSNIFEIADAVQKPNVHYVLTEKGRPKAVVLSYDEYESLLETIGTYEDIPNLNQDIAEVEEDMKNGNWKNYASLDEILAQYGYQLADKGKEIYDVRSTRKAKSSKKPRQNPR